MARLYGAYRRLLHSRAGGAGACDRMLPLQRAKNHRIVWRREQRHDKNPMAASSSAKGASRRGMARQHNARGRRKRKERRRVAAATFKQRHTVPAA